MTDILEEFEDDDVIYNEPLGPVARLRGDVRKASDTMSDDEARFLVDAYYALQRNRIRDNNQVRALSEGEEPCLVIQWLAEQNATLEKQIKASLDRYSRNHPVGAWARSNKGVGPVIAAGFLAHIDIRKAPSPGNIYSFAGLNPTIKWEKGQKRPFNAGLKVLCWKLGQSFLKVKGRESAYYGEAYVKRFEYEHAQSEAGAHREIAAQLAAKKANYSPEAKARLAEGKLSLGHLHARTARHTVKLFLSHLHCVWRWIELEELQEAPYVLEHAGHVHFIHPPNLDLAPGLREALGKKYGIRI